MLGINDKFVKFEKLLCEMFMGGIWDELEKMIGSGGKKDEKEDEKKKE
jgi:hypothetical protein